MINPHELGEGIAFIDFQTRFPHRYWYTSWTSSEEHPGRFRYKLMSTRDARPAGPIELVVVIEEADGRASEVNRVEVSAAAFEKTAAVYVDGISASGPLTFFAVDLTRCRSGDEYRRILQDAGWYDAGP